jgi:hypothetical protein
MLTFLRKPVNTAVNNDLSNDENMQSTQFKGFEEFDFEEIDIYPNDEIDSDVETSDVDTDESMIEKLFDKNIFTNFKILCEKRDHTY